ncbi:uncharacterized protein LOC104427459 [Eucalyptus grandis]|uniref:uncharacterized protein LOC104427459 n=1 Tax=Eucalyptus grandis TaxID=71139 RepID=UPI000527E91C|nr:uncharacterized protein LOC104427459 [Eucalyptus grandis]
MATQSFTITTNDDFILTTVTADPATTTNWISNVRRIHSEVNPLIIGFAIEYCQSPEQLREPVDTLQLCDGNACLVFQIRHAAVIPDSLREFLNDPNNVFVGVRILPDCNKLFAYHGLRIGNRAMAFDLRSPFMARSEGQLRPGSWGYRRLVKEILGKDYAPPRGLLNSWDNEVLTYEQVKYACLDAFYCFEMGKVLAVGRLPVPA